MITWIFWCVQNQKQFLYCTRGRFFCTVHLETTHGLDFKTPKFPRHVIYSRYRIDEENLYMPKKALCDILDELCSVSWTCMSWLIITSYFLIKFLLSRFSSLFVHWFFSPASYEEFSFDFQRFLFEKSRASEEPLGKTRTGRHHKSKTLRTKWK